MPKPVPKPLPKQPAAPRGPHGMNRDHDLPWNEKKVSLFKALKTLKAVSQKASVTVSEVTNVSGLTSRDVRHYAYHARAGGLVEVERVSGENRIYLTPAGVKVNPEREQKKAETSKLEEPAA